MSGLDGFTTELSQQLGRLLPQAEVVPNRSERSLYHAPARPLVCVSLAKIQVKDSALGGCYGVKSDGVRLGKAADLTVGFRIYCREDDGDLGCGGIFAALSEVLLFDEDLCLQEISCGPVEYLPKREVFSVDAQARLSVLLVQDQEESLVSSFHLSVANPVSL